MWQPLRHLLRGGDCGAADDSLTDCCEYQQEGVLTVAVWTAAFRLPDRELDARLRRLAETACRVRIDHEAEAQDPRSGSIVAQRRGTIQWRDVEIGLIETITAWSLQASVSPVAPETYAVILAMALVNGSPTAAYHDQYPGGREDLTAWWVRPQVADGALQVRHLVEHSARGYAWTPLDVEEVVRRARKAL